MILNFGQTAKKHFLNGEAIFYLFEKQYAEYEVE